MQNNKQKVVVIGGGAAGFFAAISCKTHHPNLEVIILEKTAKLLSKVKVSGGGRCNLTHACFDPMAFSKHYPRGEKFLRKCFAQFSSADTVEWFKKRGVKLKTEKDGRMFPLSDNSQTIIDCLLKESSRLGVQIQLKSKITALHQINSGWQLTLEEGKKIHCMGLIVASGGSAQLASYEWLSQLGICIESPIPSLFTFNMPSEPIKSLMGIAMEKVSVKIAGTKMAFTGPLLITHWGMSGPVVLKLSAYGAKFLNENQYRCTLLINWLSDKGEDALRGQWNAIFEPFSDRQVYRFNPFDIPKRLWVFLMQKVGISESKKWAELSNKEKNKIIETLVNDSYRVEGKTTFKEEFVTCGGVALSEINAATMGSKKHKGLYFAGEVLDIDGVTGGFNFQAAWTTGFIAGRLA